jgi:hypothetical protein
MFPYELDALFLSKFFRKKLRVPPLVDPRVVEINIFADLTISKRQKVKHEDPCLMMGNNDRTTFTLSILLSTVKE